MICVQYDHNREIIQYLLYKSVTDFCVDNSGIRCSIEIAVNLLLIVLTSSLLVLCALSVTFMFLHLFYCHSMLNVRIKFLKS